MNTKRNVHYYVEVPVEDNEAFAEFMTAHGGGNELTRAGKMDTDGKRHDVWYLSGTGLTPGDIKKVKRKISGLKLFRTVGNATRMENVSFMLVPKKKKPVLQTASSLKSKT